MMAFIVFCLVIAVLILLARTSALREADELHQNELRALERRLKQLQAAQQAALKAQVAAAPLPAQPEAVPSPAPTSDITWTVVTPPPPPPEPELAPLPIEASQQPEPVALEGLPIAPVEVKPLAETPIAPARQATPPPLPPMSALAALARANAPEPLPEPEPVPSFETISAAPPAPPPAAPPEPPQSFELRLGTYWFVRVGVVILLTGFVFLANLAYRHIVPQLGAAGKVALLYLGSGALLGAGAWLSRKAAKESLQNFAQVLLAGGLGAVYFTTYAAHHYEPLRVIGSAVLDGALLLGWAGFIVWLADRRKSETLALFALGLGFYTAVVTRVGTFTLASNLVLTLATVVFLVRNRWAKLTLAGLVASYGGFAFWRFFHDGQWLLGAPREHLEVALAFLAGYWICFTAATFLAEGDTLADQRRAAFLSANNGAFFALAVLSMASQREGKLWLFCLGFGAVLMALAAFARMRLPQEPSVRAAYVTQGLLLLTVGLILKFTGHQLAVLLAAESVVLLTLGLRQPSRLLRAGSFVAAGLAVGWLVLTARPADSPVLGLGVTALLLFNAWWMGRHEDPADAALLRARTAVFAVLALAAGGATILQQAERSWTPVWLAGAGLLLTLSVHLLRTREITFFAQGYLLLAHVHWHFGNGGWTELPAWRPALLLAATLVVLHWWTRQTVVGDRKLGGFFEGGYALAVIPMLFTWMNAHCTPPQSLVAASVLALGVTGYGAATRAWRLAATGQVFTLVAVVNFLRHVGESRGDDWAVALAPIAMLMLTAGAVRFAERNAASLTEELRTALQVLVPLYFWVAFAMLVVMAFHYVPAEQRPWVFALGGGVLFAFAGWQKFAQPLLASGIALGLGLLTLLAPGVANQDLLTIPNLFAVLLPLALQQVARRAPERFPMPANAHAAVVLVAGGFLWLHLTRWLLPERDGHWFTVAWSVLGPVFLAAGLWLRERTYLVLGLVCLLAALVRVVFHDAWQPELLLLNVLPMLGVLALQRVARRHPEGAALPEDAHTAAIFASGLTLWLFLSRWVVQAAGGKFFLTVSWAVLALAVFAAGFALRERMYRWLGLAVLAGAVGRVVFLDVWQLALVYRVLAFMALGVVLIVLGYIYNRWQDKIREWL
jgi:hypothetical protein